MSDIAIANLRQTCRAFPSQWEGELTDGRCFYVRYRHGELSIGFGDSVQKAVANAYDSDRDDVEGIHHGLIEWEAVLPHFNRALATEATR